ncbi:MAG: ATP-binding protein [Tannerellaceae bacterium]|nr:ATP-binding protein [Tannerellaceae bacterium]
MNIQAMRFLSLTFICCLLAIATGHAVELFHHLTEEDGLSSRRCFSVQQDKFGYMWISTKLGVDRFDGKNIRQYTLPEEYQRDYGQLGVNYLRYSPDSTLWVFTETGLLLRYSKAADRFEVVYSVRDFLHTYSLQLSDICFAGDNRLLLSTSKGVVELNTATFEARHWQGTEEIRIYQVTTDGTNYYLATWQGLWVVQVENYSIQLTSRLFPGKIIPTLFLDPVAGHLFVGTLDEGVYLYTLDGSNTLAKLPVDTDRPVRAIIDYTHGRVAVGVDQAGVFILDKTTGGLLAHHYANENDPSPICSNNVRGLGLDKAGNLWVATYHEGVSYQRPSRDDFSWFVHQPGNSQSITDNMVNAVLEDSGGDFWFGTSNGISHYNRQTGHWKSYFSSDRVGEKGFDILTLCEDNEGTIWAGGYAFGVARIHKQSGKAERFTAGSPGSVIASNYIYSIFADGSKLWFGGHMGDANYHDLATGRTQQIDLGRISCFDIYEKDILLLGLLNGLFLFNKETRVITPTPITKTVHTIARAGEGKYWIGTQNWGVYYYDIKGDSICQYTRADGLSSDYVYGIVPDGQQVWITTERGLNRLIPATGQIEVFDKQDGLVSDQFNANAVFRCRDGQVLLGTSDGAILFNPATLEKTAVKDPYPTLIHQFDLYNTPIHAGEPGAPLLQPIFYAEKIRLAYNQNFFSFHFTTPNFEFPGRILYSYYLEGHDRDWSVPSAVDIASYSRVPPGNYTFYVRSVMNGVGQPARSVVLLIAQPWWLTVWAKLCYLLALLFIAYYVYKAIKARERERQTEEKVDFFITTAHDLLTPLNLIQAPLKDLKKEAEVSGRSAYLLQMALNNSTKLAHYVEKLLDFQRISLNATRLVLSRQEPDAFLRYRLDSFRLVAANKMIAIEYVADESVRQPAWFDKEKLSRIFDNLLSNAIKYTPYGGCITVTARMDGANWYLQVRDTGIGISVRDQRMVFKHIFRAENAINSEEIGSGIGLKLVGSLVKLHKGKIAFRSKPGEGTEFNLTFPLHYEEVDGEVIVSRVEATEPVASLTEIVEKPRILVVEDDPEMARYLELSLQPLYQVYLAGNGVEALRCCEEFQPQLLISDVMMPAMNGFELCRQVKENVKTSHIPFLLVTGLTDPQNVLEGIRLGAIDYIAKPFDQEVLKAKIHTIFNQQHTLQRRWLEELKSENAAELNNKVDQEFMEKLMSFIEANMDNPDLNIHLLCREMAMSRTLLYNKITSLTGQPPTEFIRTIRLRRAAALLVAGGISITEVAEQVGISNPKYFSRVFKEFYGVSPRDYLAK